MQGHRPFSTLTSITCSAGPKLTRWSWIAPGGSSRSGSLVVGRSAAGFAASPERVHGTERLVNRVYTLMTGRDWDLMFAMRRLTASAGRADRRGMPRRHDGQ
jgi:hypothetical protein